MNKKLPKVQPEAPVIPTKPQQGINQPKPEYKVSTRLLKTYAMWFDLFDRDLKGKAFQSGETMNDYKSQLLGEIARRERIEKAAIPMDSEKKLEKI